MKEKEFTNLLDKLNPSDYEDERPMKWLIEKLQSYRKKNIENAYFDEDENYLFDNFTLGEDYSVFYYSDKNIFEALRKRFSMDDKDVKNCIRTLLRYVMGIKQQIDEKRTDRKITCYRTIEVRGEYVIKTI
jgi:hypothetical protein